MKILVSWLRDYVDVPVGVQDLAWALHLLGFEVASVEPVPGRSAVDDDGVIDFEITANRPDCLSVLGIAREVATHYERPLRLPATSGVLAEGEIPLSVTIEAPDLCPRYAAAMIDVTIGPSPTWMQIRLAAAGVRAINNVVDVTNYVLLETGHPLHAFDYARLAGAELRIRRARPSESLVTLDGVTRTMAEDMLVIADRDRASAVAGVMGGGDSEVSSATRVIALESAYFQPSSIRRTSKRLQLSTEASYRFERGGDPEAPVRALARACQLLEQIGAGHVRPGWIDAFPGRREPRAIPITSARVARVIGKKIEPSKTERLLADLGFTCEWTGTSDAPAWNVVVPSWRGDVAGDMDLVEEIARHDGYENLPTTFPALVQPTARPDARLRRDGVARRIALGMGFSECVTFAFVERAAAAPFVDEADMVAIANPLSEKFAVLRPVVLTGVLDSLAHNRRRERRDVQLFETGSRFTKALGEFRGIALGWTGAGATEHWSGSGRPVDFFDIKGAVEGILTGLGLQASFTAAGIAWLVAGRTAQVTVADADGGARVVGACGQLLPAIATARGVPPQDEVYVAELDLDAVSDLVDFGERVGFAALPRFPSIVRDLSLVVDERLLASDLRASIRAAAPPTLVEVQEFARYQGKGISDGAMSLSFRLTFRAAERTLTDAEVQSAVEGIVAALAERHGARLR